MYDFIDRPVAALDPGGRLFVGAMRRWVAAMAAQECPPAAIGPAFQAAHALPALSPFHNAMLLLNRSARETVRVAPMACARIAEGEAVMLQALASIGRVPPARMQATLAMVVSDEAAEQLLGALLGVALAFMRSGLEMGIAA